MDDLCDSFDGFRPLHDTQEEYRLLQISRNMSIEELAGSDFLKKSFNRFKRYSKYINFHKYFTGELVYFLIQEFLQHQNVPYNSIYLACKCIVIDSYISDIIDNEYGVNDFDD
jgi:hypothetical protein